VISLGVAPSNQRVQSLARALRLNFCYAQSKGEDYRRFRSLAGSGPALFTMLKDKAQAEDLYIRCENQGMEVYMVGMGGIC